MSQEEIRTREREREREREKRERIENLTQAYQNANNGHLTH
jgi:hypothetical protein